MKKLGKTTGSKRQLRWALMTVTWDTCDHYCPSCKLIWSHKIPQNQPAKWADKVGVVFNVCHLEVYSDCGNCLEYPTNYNLLCVKKKEKRK